jgi:hypothetical protein
MATASCGSITVNGYRFYNGGWSETTFRSLAASYSRTGGDPDYVTVDKITLPSFTNAKFVAPYTLKLSIPITKGSSTVTTTSGTLTVHMYSSDPGGTKQYATSPSPTNPPSGYIGSGSASYSGLNNDIQTFDISVKISDTDLTSGTSYYLWIQTTSLTMIHLEGKAPTGTLTGTVATFPVTYDANGGSPTPSS